MSMERDSWMREVDEELRRERLQKIWNRYGTLIMVGLGVVVVGIGGFQWWRSQQISNMHSTGARYLEALKLAEDGKAEDANKALDAIAKGGAAGYAKLAKLRLAGEAAVAGEVENAASNYNTIANQGDDPLVSGYARLQAAALKIDTSDWTEIKNQLTDLVDEKSPWRFAAREIMGLSAFRARKLDEAKQMLAPLSTDPRAPETLRQRASALMNLVVAAELAKSAPSSVELEKTEDPKPAPKPDAKVPNKAGETPNKEASGE